MLSVVAQQIITVQKAQKEKVTNVASVSSLVANVDVIVLYLYDLISCCNKLVVIISMRIKKDHKCSF